DDLLKTDKFLLTIGIDEASQKTVSLQDTNTQTVRLSQAYLDGINQFIENGPTPIEFYLTGLEKRPFVLKDIYNTVGYMAFSFAMAHKTDPLLSNIRKKLGTAYLEDLEIDIDSRSTLIQNYNPLFKECITDAMADLVAEVMKKVPLPQ